MSESIDSDGQDYPAEYLEMNLRMALATALFVLLSGHVEGCKVHRPTLNVALGCISAKTDAVLQVLEKIGFVTITPGDRVILTEKGYQHSLILLGRMTL